MSKSTFASFFGGTLGVLFALAFFIVGLPVLACMGCFGLAVIGSSTLPDQPLRSSSSDFSADEAAANISSNSEPSAPDTGNAVSASTTAESKPADSPKEFGLGDSVHVGYTTYAVWSAWWSDTLSDNQFLNQPPNASYLFINLTVRNDDTKARLVPPLKLLDENNAEYQASANGWAVEGSIGILESLNPGVSKQGFVVFDVPRDHVYKLKVSGGYWSGEEVLIAIGTPAQSSSAAIDQQTANRDGGDQKLEEEFAAIRRDEQIRLREEENQRQIEEQKLIEGAKWRTWTADGVYRTEAKFVKAVGGTVTLEKKDGKQVDIAMGRLSAEDQDFIRQRKWLKVP